MRPQTRTVEYFVTVVPRQGDPIAAFASRDVGLVSASTEAGRRFGRYFTVTLRGGYGARRVDSSGFTGGANLRLAF